jgi:hypothetical protein
MSYTDEDIQDLYEDLSTIGLAETPAEEAHRHFVAFHISIKDKLITTKKAHFFHLREFLIQNQIPHTYVSRLTVRGLSNGLGSFSFEVFPVIREQGIMTICVMNIDSLQGDIQRHEDFSSLLAYTEGLRDKYSHLLSSDGLETLNIV